MKFEKQVSLKWAIALVLIACLVSSSIVYYVFAVSPSSAFTISSGVYPGAPSYTVWKEGGYYFAKDANGEIDYSGTDCLTLIEDVIDALPTGVIEGGTIFFKGTPPAPNNGYWLSNTLTITKKNVHFVGESKGVRTGTVDDRPVCLVNWLGSTWGDFDLLRIEADGFQIENMQLQQPNLNYENMQVLSSNTTTANFGKIDNVIFVGGAVGLRLNGTMDWTIENSYFISCNTSIWVEDTWVLGWPGIPTRIFVNNIFSEGAKNQHIYINQASGITISQCTFENTTANPSYGIWLYNTVRDVTIQDCWFENIYTNDAQMTGGTVENIFVFGCHFQNRHVSPSIYGDGVRFLTLKNNHWYVSALILQLAGTGELNWENNFYDGTLSIAGTIKARFIGAGFQNSGTATITASTTVTFNHGLAGTPTHVECGFKNFGYGSWWWTATSTQITITVVTSGTYTFSWYAEYKP
jgi:hypothetical protein